MFPQLDGLSCVRQEVSDPLAGGVWHVQLVKFTLRSAGLMVLKADVKSTNRILVQDPGNSRCCRVRWRVRIMASSTNQPNCKGSI